jgi:hypothetical protein
MSKNINVNPDHYKVAGRERQGEHVIHQIEKAEIKRLRRSEKRASGQGPQAPSTGSRTKGRSTTRTPR